MRKVVAMLASAAVLAVSGCGESNRPVKVELVQAAEPTPSVAAVAAPTKPALAAEYLKIVNPLNKISSELNVALEPKRRKLSTLKRLSTNYTTENWKALKLLRKLDDSIQVSDSSTDGDYRFYSDLSGYIRTLISECTDDQEFYRALADADTLNEYVDLFSNHQFADGDAARNIRVLLDLPDIPS
jgi:hypothetical protein